MLKTLILTVALTIAALAPASTAALAQIATTLEQAELDGLAPETRADLEARVAGGNSVYEVLQTMLLNNIKAKHPGSQIIALDFNRGKAVVELPDRELQIVSFDTKTLQIGPHGLGGGRDK